MANYLQKRVGSGTGASGYCRLRLWGSACVPGGLFFHFQYAGALLGWCEEWGDRNGALSLLPKTRPQIYSSSKKRCHLSRTETNTHLSPAAFGESRMGCRGPQHDFLQHRELQLLWFPRSQILVSFPVAGVAFVRVMGSVGQLLPEDNGCGGRHRVVSFHDIDRY